MFYSLDSCPYANIRLFPAAAGSTMRHRPAAPSHIVWALTYRNLTWSSASPNWSTMLNYAVRSLICHIRPISAFVACVWCRRFGWESERLDGMFPFCRRPIRPTRWYTDPHYSPGGFGRSCWWRSSWNVNNRCRIKLDEDHRPWLTCVEVDETGSESRTTAPNQVYTTATVCTDSRPTGRCQCRCKYDHVYTVAVN